MDVMGFRSMEIDGLYDGEWNEGIPEPENPLHLERAYRCSHLCELVQPSTAEVVMTYGKDFYDGMPAMTRNVYGKGKAYAVCADFEQGLYDEVCRKLAEEAGVERIVEEVPEGVEVTVREQKDGTRYVFVQNFNREAVEVKLPIERYPVWQGTYDGTIGSWNTDCAERKIEEKKSLLRKTGMGCFSTDFFRSCICGSVFFLRQLFLIRLAPVPHRIHDRVEAEAEFRQGIFDTRRYLGVNFTVDQTALFHLAELGS